MQAFASPFDGAVGFEVFQHALESDLGSAFEIESAGDFPFADFGFPWEARAPGGLCWNLPPFFRLFSRMSFIGDRFQFTRSDRPSHSFR
ncbi:MAG: hypothetical protein ACREC0_10270 [Methylocella sp.]